MMPASRMQASDLFQDWVDDPIQIYHAFAVENVMRIYAEKFGEDPKMIKKWGLVGFLHDMDYQECPEEHCHKSKEVMTMAGYDEDFIRAIMSHEYMVFTDVKPESNMEKVLYTVNKLVDLVAEAALSLPSKNINDLDMEYAMEKYNDPEFAVNIDRSVIDRGVKMMETSIEDVMKNTLTGMTEIAYTIGLDPDEDE